MNLYAGKTWSSRYDKKAPTHLGIQHEDDTDPKSACVGMTVFPILKGAAVDVTCTTCQRVAFELNGLLTNNN